MNVCPINLSSAISRPEVHSDIIDQSVELIISSVRISVVAKFRETFSAFTSVKMWRCLSNVEPPRKKAKSGENQSAERFKQYDKQTRQRKFQSAWKKDDQGREREWLVFDDEMESMFCSACRTFAKTDQDKKGPFVVGTNKFKLENIKAHELSKSHI